MYIVNNLSSCSKHAKKAFSNIHIYFLIKVPLTDKKILFNIYFKDYGVGYSWYRIEKHESQFFTFLM